MNIIRQQRQADQFIDIRWFLPLNYEQNVNYLFTGTRLQLIVYDDESPIKTASIADNSWRKHAWQAWPCLY